MSRKTILIILGILIVVLGVWVFVESSRSSNGGAAGSSKGILGSLFPFGSSTQVPVLTGTTSTTTGGTSGNPTATAMADRLTQITKNPTAGFMVVFPPPPVPAKKVSGSKASTAAQLAAQAAAVTLPAIATAPATIYPTVEYAESGTGYIYTADAKGENATKLSDTVIARTAQAFFGDNGASVILQYVGPDNQTVSTYLAHFVPAVDSLVAGTLTGSFLPDGISDLVMSPDGKSFAYVLPNDTDGSAIETETTDGKTIRQTLSSAFDEWLIDWYGKGMVITTKAASVVPGYAYLIQGNALAKVIGGVNGLTTKMSPDGKNVLYSVSTQNGVDLRILHLSDGSDVSTGLSTLPEKCAWTPDSARAYCGAGVTLPSGDYPDSWYQGSTHFNDAIWQVSAAAGTTTQLSDGEGKDLDVTELALDSTGRFLVFINKNDGSLWSFDLNPPAPVATAASSSVTTTN